MTADSRLQAAASADALFAEMHDDEARQFALRFLQEKYGPHATNNPDKPGLEGIRSFLSNPGKPGEGGSIRINATDAANSNGPAAGE